MRILLLCALLVSGISFAEPFIELGLGKTFFKPTVPDGVWYQQTFPHQFQTQDTATRVGLGWKFNIRWSVSVNYLRLGSNSSNGQFVWDHDYDQNAHKCKANCDAPYTFRAVDSAKGPELALTRTFDSGTVSPYLRGGYYRMLHRVDVSCTTFDGGNCGTSFSGRVPMLFLGAGLRYKYFGLEVSYYKAIDSGPEADFKAGFPISTKAIVPMLSVTIPLL